MKTTPDRTKTAKTDWRRFDAMTEAERHRAALDDPDALPLTEDDLARMKRTPQAKVIRRALGLSQEEFAARYQIPIGTLRDWEQGRARLSQGDRPRAGPGAHRAQAAARVRLVMCGCGCVAARSGPALPQSR
jgi:putative transcriptional regulator